MATAPSSFPINPSFSVVVAFIEIFSGTVSRISDMVAFISGMKGAIFGFSRQTVLSMFIM